MSKKNKLSKKDKKMFKENELARDTKALEIFGKHECALSLTQRFELDDWMKPVWKLVETDRGDLVEVSNAGQVRDPETKELYEIFYTEDSNGRPWYPQVYIKSKRTGKMYQYSVHRLIARAFCKNDDPEHKTQVNHIDGHKDHNWAGNLEFVTPSENTKHAYETGLSTARRGEDSNFAKFTENHIINVCDLLCEHPDWTFERIADEACVTTNVVGSVYRKERWQHIVNKYNFPPRDTQVSHAGEDNGAAKNTNDQIRQACELLQNRPDLTYDRISEITGVAPFTLSLIYHGKTWTSISKDYVFPPRETVAKFTEEQVKHVCQLLQDHPDWSYTKIAEETGVNVIDIGPIYRGETWANISKNYTFPPRDGKRKGENHANAKFNSEQAEAVCKLLDDVYLGKVKMTSKEIADETGVDKKFVNHIRYEGAWANVAKNHPFYQAKFGNK